MQMAGPVRLRSIARIVLVASLVAASFAGPASPLDATSSGPSRWTGGVDLYRSGVFTTQKTWLWCTAADIQIIRNIVNHQADHSRSSQQRYFDYMRAHDRYAIPVTDGVDPAGWTAGLRHFVDGRYRLYASPSFDSALRAAVTNLRETNLPVGITVQHGNHAWVLTGFTATADPAITTHFTVTSVRVVGPLWGLQSRTYGYDMRPDTKLTPGQLKGFFTPWHYARVRMAWEGRWVSVQPVAASTSASKTPPTPASTVRSTEAPTPAATMAPTPGATASSEPTATSDPGITAGPAAVAAIETAPPTGSGAPDPNLKGSPSPASATNDVATGWTVGLLAVSAIALLLIGGAAAWMRRKPAGPRA